MLDQQSSLFNQQNPATVGIRGIAQKDFVEPDDESRTICQSMD
jgi:hypothetical protein